MSNRIRTATCSAVIGLATTALMAQTPAPTQSTTPQSSTPQSATPSTGRRVVITGCLTQVPAAGTTDSASGAAGGATGGASSAGAAGAAGGGGPRGARGGPRGGGARA